MKALPALLQIVFELDLNDKRSDTETIVYFFAIITFFLVLMTTSLDSLVGDLKTIENLEVLLRYLGDVGVLFFKFIFAAFNDTTLSVD